MVADRAQHFAWERELSAGYVAHARCPGDVAGIVEGDAALVVRGTVEGERSAPNQVVGDLDDVLRDGVARVEEVERPRQGMQEAVRNPPCVPALAEHDPLHPELQRRLADAKRHLAHVLVAADEEPEVRRFRCPGAQRPPDAGLVKHLGVADEAVDVGLGEEVRGRGDEQDLGSLLVEGESDRHPRLVLDVFLEPFEGVGERGLRQPEIVPDLVDLADDLVAVLLPEADAREYLAARHRHLRGVDAVGAEHRAAPALRALVEVAVPVLQHLLGEVGGADELREQPAGQREVAPVDLAQQVLARHRHVLRVRGAEVVVALVGAGAALDAGVEEDAQAPVPAEQLAHLGDRRVVPVLDEFAREAERLLVVGGGHERAAVRHRAFDDDRDLGEIRDAGGLERGLGHQRALFRPHVTANPRHPPPTG